MTDFVILTTSDQAVIPGGDTRTIHFRPVRSGNVTVRCTPAEWHVHSESGYLAQVNLFRPGKAQPLKSVKAKVGANPQQPVVLELTYPATDADLATAGDWTCEVFNWADVDISFVTEVSCFSTIPLAHKTASFDVELLNFVLAEAIADSGLSWHLQSSADAADTESLVSWSAAVADSLPDPWKGLTSYPFQLPDIPAGQQDIGIGTFTTIVFRLDNLDSDPAAPILAFISPSNGVPSLEVYLSFNTQNAKLVAIDSDVDIDKLGVEIDLESFRVQVDVLFDGTIRASTETTATARAVDALVTADVSGLVNGKIQDKVEDKIRLDPRLARAYLDQFFVALMRLGTQASIQQYSIDGNALVVNYTVPEPLPHPVPVPHPVPHPIAHGVERQ